MSKFGYKNINEILSTKGFTRGIRLIDTAETRRIIPRFDKINPNTTERITGGFESIEMHVFNINTFHLLSIYDLDTWTIDNTAETNNLQIQLDIHKDLETLDLSPSTYRVVYNFFRNFIGSAYGSKMFISEISSDRTELKLSLSEPENPIMLEQLKTFVLDYLSPKKYLPPIILNFGENQIVSVINLTSDGSTTSFYVKLYEELPDTIELFYECWVGSEIIKPYLEIVSIEQPSIPLPTNKIAGPNFDVETNYWTISETDYKSWTDLLSTNVATSQEILNRYIFDSGSTVKLNVDFTEFQNFIFYSSAEERVKNFVYKVNLIETYNTQLSIIDGYSGSFTGSLSHGAWNPTIDITGSVSASFVNNKINIRNLKNKVLGGFDEFEKWLYYDLSGSYNYTFQTTASITPYPKYEVSSSDFDINTKFGKYKLYGVTSNEFTNWYEDLLDKATDFDMKNFNSLNRTIPEEISIDSENSAYVSFVNMIGQHFDIMYLYTDHITKKNTRIENPKDGLSQDLVYNVTQNLGWTLTHGTQAKDLWEYALGLSGSGEPIWTGKTLTNRYDTLTDEERTKEVWRRILNNLPYIYKTKGTARGIKALLSAYGIPQTMLSIREFGGPDIADFGVIPRADFEKSTYFLNFGGTYPLPTRQHHVSVPWERVNNDVGEWTYPDTVTFRWRMEPEKSYGYGLSPTQTLLQKNSGSNVDWFVVVSKDSTESERGSVYFYLGNGSGYATASITDQYLYDDVPLNLMIRRSLRNDQTSSNQVYDFILKTNKYGKIAVETSASIVVSGSISGSYNQRWTRDGVLYIGSGSNSETTDILSGSIFELRYWSRPLSTASFNNHVLSARSYNGNTSTSSFYDLQAQWKFWQRFDASVTKSLESSHPNQKKNTFYSSSKKATFHGFNSSSWEPIYEVYSMEVPSTAGDTPYAQKTRIDSSSLYAGIHPYVSTEISIFDESPVDSNKLMVAFSPQHIINEDIYEAIGHTTIDDYFGFYDDMYKNEYPKLKWFAREYWQKYPNKNDFTAYINLISIYDFSLFEQIRQTLPARANPILGVVVEPNVLERSKVAALRGVEGESRDKFVKETPDLNTLPEPNANVEKKVTTIYIGFDTVIRKSQDINFGLSKNDIDLNFNLEGDKDNLLGEHDIKTVTHILNNNKVQKVDDLQLKPVTRIDYRQYMSLIDETKLQLVSKYNNLNTTISDKLKFVSNINKIYTGSMPPVKFVVLYKRISVYPDGTLQQNIGYGKDWNYRESIKAVQKAHILPITSSRRDDYYTIFSPVYSTAISASENMASSFIAKSAPYMNPHNLPAGTRNRNFEGSKNKSEALNYVDPSKPFISQPAIINVAICPERPCPPDLFNLPHLTLNRNNE